MQPPSALLPPAGSRWTAGPVVAVVAGAATLALGATLATGAGALLVAHEDGFVTTPSRSVETDGYAVVSDVILLEGAGLDEGLGRLRLSAQADDDVEVFLGIGAASDVRAYLDGVSHSVLRGPLLSEADRPGGPPATEPSEATWLASVSGPGGQVLETDPEPGRWVLVVMHPDAAAGVSATVEMGAELPWLTPAAGALIALGAVLVLIGASAIAIGVRAATVRHSDGAPSTIPS